MEHISPFHRVIYFYVKLNTVIVMTFKEDFKPSRVYNKQVYKSELDYLYDDNENNVDKANNENNETEIIEAEEVDTSKIDWDW